MLELLRPKKDNTENHITDLIDQLEYLFTHVDVNNFTADMREKWESLIRVVKELKQSFDERTLKNNEQFQEIAEAIYSMSLFQANIDWKIMSVAYPVGSYVVSNESDVSQIEELYNGTWAKMNEISGNSGMTKSYVYKRIE